MRKIDYEILAAAIKKHGLENTATGYGAKIPTSKTATIKNFGCMTGPPNFIAVLYRGKMLACNFASNVVAKEWAIKNGFTGVIEK